MKGLAPILRCCFTSVCCKKKWFRIPSDPELENQINDRLSFKKFLDISFCKPVPDHSAFSRFRFRLSKEDIQLNIPDGICYAI